MMVAVGLLVSASLSLISGVAFFAVGRAVSRRNLAGEEARANQAFVMWWYTLGGLSLVTAAFSLAAAAGYTDLALHVTLLHVALLVLFVGLWGVAYYLAYLFTGDKRWRWVLGVFYSVYYVWIVFLVVRAVPNRVEVGTYGAQLGYEHELTDFAPFVNLLLLLLILPQVVGAFAYFSLIFRVKAPMQRYRIGMVAGTFIVWFGSSIVASVLNLAETTLWWRPVSQAFGVVAALVVFLAYKPPRRVVRALEAREPRTLGGPA